MASLMPNGKQQYFDPSTGAPLAGGKLFTFVGGTSTPKDTWQDAGATIKNQNPIPLDTTGSAVVFWSGNYKVQLQDSLGNVIYTVDNYSTDSRDHPVQVELQTASAGQTVFMLTTTNYTPGINSLHVYVDGLRVIMPDYAETSSNVVTFASPLAAGQMVMFECGSAANSQSSLDASIIPYTPGGSGGSTNVAAALNKRIYADQFPTLAQAIAAAPGKTLVIDGTFTLNNSAADGLLINLDNIHITGRGTLNCTSIAYSGIKITGKNCLIENITVTGPGTYDTSGTGGAVIPGLVYIDGTGLGAPINCTLRNLKVLEPGKMGIVAYKAVGFDIVNCRVENSQPVATWLNTSNNHLIRAYACARFNITGNRLKGFSEGIVVQSYDSATYNFDDYAGITSNNKSRKFNVAGNQVVATYDHAIYICNENEHYTCNGNFLWMASDAEGGEGTCSLKLEGGYFEACGNYAREGIQLRNPYNARVDNNVVSIYSGRGTTHNPSKMGILSQDTIYQRPLAGLSVNNNTIIVTSAMDVDAGIWIEGSVWGTGSYQSQITDLSVCGNNIIGVGQNSTGVNGLGILIHQDMPTSGGVVTGSTGQGVTVCGNNISMSTFTAYTGGTGSYGIELLNIDSATVNGNTVRNFSQRGINLLGVRYSMIGENNLFGNSASASQKFATYEDASNTAMHVDSVSNTYGTNNAKNVDYKYFIADQTSVCKDLIPLINFNATNANQTISAYDECELLIWAPTTTGLTLTFSTSRPWANGQKIKVVNRGSQSFNVTNTSTTISAGNAVTFCCTGSNTFIAYV